MKKVLFVLAVLMLVSSSIMAQYIPFTNTVRIYSLDSGSVKKFLKIPLSQTGYKNFYIQRSGIMNYPYNIDMRHGNIYKYLYSAGGFSDSAHYRALHNSWDFNFTYGYSIGYVEDFIYSPTDTNLLLFTYWPANWEPYATANYSINNGQTITQIFTQTFMAQCGGVAIDPVNDSVMYCTFHNGSLKNVFKTTNRGANWITVDTISSGIMYCKLFVNKFNRNTIFLNMNSDLYRSTTGGTDFQTIKTGVSNVRIFFDASDNTIYMSSTSSDGFLKSTNNGDNWTTLLNRAVGDFEFDPLNSNIVYAGCTDGLYKSINKGSTWMLYNNSFMPDVNVKGIVKNPNAGDTLFVSTNKAVYKVYGPSVVDTSVTSYFPLAVGNIYVYSYGSIMPPSIDKYKIRITKDTVVAGKRFFYSSQIFPGFNANENWIRMDGVTGVITSLSNTSCNYLINEQYIDSLRSSKNDTIYKCTLFSKSTCIDTSNINVFGYPSKQKVFMQDGLVLNHRTYSKNYGLIISEFWEGGNIVHNLIGCRINGVTYGDTLLTSIANISSEIPSIYSLSQNYPNPFNPTTKIKFAMPKAGDAKIIVYDDMGRELQTLVNERLQPGTYESTFDGSTLNSGVYFYQLLSGTFKETKKMILIK